VRKLLFLLPLVGLLASCSGSPIKKLVCERHKGDPEPMEFIFDPQAKILYVYHEVSETLKPAQKSDYPEAFQGSCEYVEPETTNVFEERAK
tara:strand:+ start:967 stop:1239 length:273 start_codon:yes stop_codon:yes gene_type:complete